INDARPLNHFFGGPMPNQPVIDMKRNRGNVGKHSTDGNHPRSRDAAPPPEQREIDDRMRRRVHSPSRISAQFKTANQPPNKPAPKAVATATAGKPPPKSPRPSWQEK